MSREIKFRVWGISQGRYLKGDGHTYEIYSTRQECLDREEGRGVGFISLGSAIKQSDIRQVTVEQFIGRQDREGRDIYEGDIVRRIHSQLVCDMFGDERTESVDLTGVITYSDFESQFQIWAKHGEGVAKANFGHVFMSWAGVKHYRVVGNIHEHSHLLNP